MAEIKSQFDYLVEQTEKAGLKIASTGGKILLHSTDDVEKRLKELRIVYYRTPEHIDVYVDKFNGSVFFSNLNSYLSFADIDFNSDFGIIGEKTFFDASRAVFTRNGNDLPEHQVYGNNIYYLKLKKLFIEGLEGKSNINRSIKPIANYHDESERTMIIISATKGTMKIGYPHQNPAFNEKYKLSLCYEMLINSLGAKGFSELFKSEIYDTLKDQPVELRMKLLVEKLSIIIDNSERNFEVYINNFSFDELKDSLREEKIKYYNLTKDVLAKIYSQITGLTLVATATAFATSKVTSIAMGVFVLIAYCTYASFVAWLMLTLHKEIKNVASDFESERHDISDKSSLTAKLIKTELDLIANRLNDVNNLILAYSICLMVLSILFCTFIVIQILSPFENSTALVIRLLIQYTIPIPVL